MNEDDWKGVLRGVHGRGVAAWKAGRRTARAMFDPKDVTFLESIGCTAQELFDFIEDLEEYGEPDVETVMEVQEIRRTHFLEVLGGRRATRIVPSSALPAKTDAIEGIPWLPRLIVKARLKLKGELPPDLMYGCGGDRPFLRRMGMTLPGFLTLVRELGDDDRAIVAAVKRSAGLR